jgi:hypothetical protein
MDFLLRWVPGLGLGVALMTVGFVVWMRVGRSSTASTSSDETNRPRPAAPLSKRRPAAV